MAYTYYNNGNIHTISKVGTYSYDSGRPHAVTAIDNAVGRAIPPTQCDVTYNLHKHPSSISGNSYSITLDHIYAEGREVTPHVKNGNADSLYYVLTDHLGSWNKVMDENKNIVQQTHFDPWGNRMSYSAWNGPQTQTTFTFDRGFTGHEHYDCLYVINANSRLYHPLIGRFL